LNELQICIYYPLDNNNKISSIINVNKEGDKEIKNVKIVGSNKEILFESNNEEIVINKLDNKQVLERTKGIYGYKLAKTRYNEPCIVKIYIPKDAKIVQPYPMDGQIIQSQKYRCNKALVVDILNMYEKPIKEISAYSYVYDKQSIEYRIGSEVIPDKFDESRYNTCTKGIHFHVYPEYCGYWLKGNEIKVNNINRTLELVPEYIHKLNTFTHLGKLKYE